MTDETRIEQRFRAANPVPDPADPPMYALSAATALLDLEERKATMQTKESPNEMASPRKRPRRALVAGVALAAVVAAGGVALFVAGNGEPPPDPESEPEDVATGFVGDPTITFDEASVTCSYSGPTQFALGEDAIFTGVNDSEVAVDMGVVALRGTTVPANQLEDPNYIVVGTGGGISLPEDAADPTFHRLSIGAREGTIPDHAGTWLITCVSPFGGDGPEFDQAVATFEVGAGG